MGVSTMAVYSAHRLVGMSKVRAFNDQGRYKIIKTFRNHILVYFIISFALSVFYFFFLDFRQIVLMVIPGLLTLSYILPIFNSKRLRDFPLIKIFLIAFVWSWLSLIIILPEVNQKLVLLFLERLLFFIAITIPFDIRDYYVDKSIEVKTLIHGLGIKKSKSLALLLLFFNVCLLIFLLHAALIDTSYFCALLIAYILSSILIAQSNTQKSDYYFSGFLDGMIGLRCAIYALIINF